jgi:hypothetical protein
LPRIPACHSSAEHTNTTCLHHVARLPAPPVLPRLQINSTLNQLDLGPSGGTSLTGLTHLVLLNKSRAGYRAMLTAAFDSLPALQRLEVQFDSFPSLLSWPLSSKDAGGRELVLQGRNGQRWVLQRSLGPATAEE